MSSLEVSSREFNTCIKKRRNYRPLLKNSCIKNIVIIIYISGLAQCYPTIENSFKTKVVCSRSLHVCAVVVVPLDAFKNVGKRVPVNSLVRKQSCILSRFSLFCLPCTHLLTFKGSVFNWIVCTAKDPL